MTLDEVVEAVDGAFERRDLVSVSALLDGFDLDAVDGPDTAVALLVATFPARLPLHEARTAYASRLRPWLAVQGVSDAAVDAALTGLL